ncbi:amidohydrolase [Eudoraea adriatica]|uniref:amidohydrolase n=1 Tax=Eudoraea adriatica TaxID=446681 RepID=UPI00037C2FC8|nr:amidohydrolase [Eudoraea adriatica]
MQSTLKVALIQTALIWENPVENRNMFSVKIKDIPGDTDMIILPEMFTTGFTMNPERVNVDEGENTVKWMKEIAQDKNMALVGSISFKKKNKYTNRLFFIHPDGTSASYDKKHTFTFAGEDKVYESGTERLVFSYKGFRICPLICYDLRFPVWARYKGDYDLLVFVANWPEPRIEAWDTLLKARAIENMSYCIGVNRLGEDNNAHRYPGHSAIYDPMGSQVVFSEKDEVIYASLSLQGLKDFRAQFKFLEDRDHFSLKQ